MYIHSLIVRRSVKVDILTGTAGLENIGNSYYNNKNFLYRYVVAWLRYAVSINENSPAMSSCTQLSIIQ